MISIKEKAYKFLTDPKFAQETDFDAIVMSKKLPQAYDIGLELALHKRCLLKFEDGKVGIIDPLNYEITNKKEKEGLSVLPKSTIIISKDGNSKIMGKEKTDNCYELSELAKAAGKVTGKKDIEHTPAYHDVHNSGRR